MLRVKSLVKTNEVANITMSERPAKHQRIKLLLEKRIELIQCVKSVPKPTLKGLSDKFGIGKSTVGDILRKKEVYKAEYRKNGNTNKKRFHNSCKFDKLNELVWQWFCHTWAENIPISGPIIQVKAIVFAKELEITDFKVQMAGLMEGWKERYPMKRFKVSGESESAGVNIGTAGLEIGVSEEWQGSRHEIPKKGDLGPCSNYRGIKLLSAPGKVLNRVILKRLKGPVYLSLRDQQAGFRPGRSSTAQITTLQIIVEQLNGTPP